MRVLVFGDSITQGFWAVERGWVDRVRRYYDQLQVKDIQGNDEPVVFNASISGDTSRQILTRIKQEVVARTWPTEKVKPVVLVQVGLNDSSLYPEYPSVDIDEYKDNLRKIVTELDGLASRIVFVGFSACYEPEANPVFWDEHYWQNSLIEQYENAMQEVAKELEINFIPVFNDFKKAVDADKSLLVDGLHPNDAGHELIYQIVMPKLQEILK